MDYLTFPLLSPVEANQIVERLLRESSSWQDGKLSAGSHASEVKNNFQLDKSSSLSIELTNIVESKVRNNNLVKSYTLPKYIHGTMFTKSNCGQGYGAHIDNTYMSTGRSDLSFTLFLNSPQDYEGGDLCIQTIQEEKTIKLDPGQIVIYPSTSIHLVNNVSSGVRLVCVGWIESYISSNEDRELLFGLDSGARGLLAKFGRSPELDLVFQSYANLLRRLGK